jgi:putative hydrolase of the HAD superfamily
MTRSSHTHDSSPGSFSHRAVDAVIWDFAGVLTNPVMSRLEEMSAAKGLPPDAMRHAIMGDYGGDGSIHPWHQLERGEIDLARYGELQRETFEALGLENIGKSLSHGFAGAGPNDAMLDLVRRVRAAGVRTAILTNNLAQFRAGWKAMVDADNLVELIIDSSEVGMRKPERRIYELTVERLEVPASRAVFLDDLEANVAGARSAGLQAIHVGHDNGPAIAEVERLAGLKIFGNSGN